LPVSTKLHKLTGDLLIGPVMPQLIVNGKNHEFSFADFPATVSALLEHLEIRAETVVAELDGDIVEQSSFQSQGLHDGMTVELVRFVGGG